MPKIVDHTAFRNQLLDRSFDLFARRGYHAVSIREIARELGVSTGALYHYFSSKEDIFEQMLERLAQSDVMEAVAQIPADAPAAGRVATLLGFVAARESYFQNLLFLLLDSLRAGGRTESTVRKTLTLYRNAISEHVTDADPAIGSFLFSTLIGLVFQRIVDAKAVGFAGHAEAAAAFFQFAVPNLFFNPPADRSVTTRSRRHGQTGQTNKRKI